MARAAPRPHLCTTTGPPLAHHGPTSGRTQRRRAVRRLGVVPGLQRIHVVTTEADADDLLRLTASLRSPVILTAPTAEAKRVVTTIAADAWAELRAEVLLAPTRFPPADRSHQLDSLVRAHALRDRFRDVVVVTDPASSTLLLRALAPDQLASRGAITVVGLPRGDRPVAVGRAVVVGLVLGLVAGVVESVVPLLVLPVALALVGVGLMLSPRPDLGRESLLAAGIALIAALAVISGSARFPGAW